LAVFRSTRSRRRHRPWRVERFSFDHPELDEPVRLEANVVRYPEDGATSAQLIEVIDETPSPA
jgi:hypothetical protein